MRKWARPAHSLALVISQLGEEQEEQGGSELEVELMCMSLALHGPVHT